MKLTKLEQLAAAWRSEAGVFRRRGQEPPAVMADSYARDLERELQEWWLETFSLSEAADELGLTASALQKRVRKGSLVNLGKNGSPRFRRCDLHRGKTAEQARLVTEDGEPDVAEEVLRASA